MELELKPLAWALLAVLVLLAIAGLYYLYTLCRGYRCLPLTTTDCPGGKPHHLVYVDDKELGVLAKIAKHTGKPCHGIRSYPVHQSTPPSSPSAKRRRTDEAPSTQPFTFKTGGRLLSRQRADAPVRGAEPRPPRPDARRQHARKEQRREKAVR